MSANGHTGNGDSQAIRLTIPAKPEFITLGRLALAGLVQSRPEPVSRETLCDLKLALTEACTNSVRHAYNGTRGSVQILYELHADRLVVEVTDDGKGFEPPVDPGATTNGVDGEGGLGLAIIDALADELEIRERGQGGSSLRFVKLL